MNFFTLTSIQTGIYVCVSAILVGHSLLAKFGLHTALVALALGSIFLWVSALLFARLCYMRKKVLIDLVSDYFGKRGAQVCGVAFAISLLGWFAIQLEMISKGVHTLFPQIPIVAGNIVFGTLITWNVLKGIQSMGRLADFSMPFLLCSMIFIFIRSYDANIPISLNAPALQGHCYLGALSFIIAASIAGVIDTPTYFCESRSEKDSYIAITLVYGVVLPLITLVGLFLAIYSKNNDFVSSIMGLGGRTWQWIMLCFLVLAGWTTNNGNLYSASMALRPWGPLSHGVRTVLLGIAGMVLAQLKIVEHFVEAVSAMSILMAALGAALLARFVSCKFLDSVPHPQEQKRYILMILFGSFMGLANISKLFCITESGFFDAFLVTMGIVFLYEGYQRCIAR